MKLLFLILITALVHLYSNIESMLYKRPDVWVKTMSSQGKLGFVGGEMKIRRVSTIMLGIANRIINCGVRLNCTNNADSEIKIAKNRFGLKTKSFTFHEVSVKYKAGDTVILTPGQTLEEIILHFDSQKGVRSKQYA